MTPNPTSSSSYATMHSLKKVVFLRIINKSATLPISIVKGDEDSIFSETGTVVIASVEYKHISV